MRLSVYGIVLTIQHLPENLNLRNFVIIIKDLSGNEVYRQYSTWSNNLTFSLKSLPNGMYSLNIGFLMGDLFWPYFAHHLPIFTKEGNCSWFTSSPFAVYNSLYAHSWSSNPKFLKRQLVSCRQYQSDDKEIVQCAEKITRGHLFPYTKMKAVHDFVASNTAYDMDALKANQYLHDDNSALATLRKGRGVCQGYTNLSIALLRSLGIPAMEATCYALGCGTNGGWEKPQNKHSMEANHVITAAFVNNRWSIMDVTWDSDFEYINDEKRVKTGCGISHRYFDMSMSMLSLTHKLIGKKKWLTFIHS